MSLPSTPRTVCAIGLWHLGSVVSASLAELGYDVIGVDPDAERVRALGQGVPPLFEPDLERLMRKHVDAGRLRFTAEMGEGVRDADVVLLTFDTPVDEQDELDLTPVTDAVQRMAATLKPNALVVIQSQVPVGTCQQLQAMIQRLNPRWHPQLACVPENLRLGQAIQRFLSPAMLVIGADESATRARVDAFLAGLSTPKRILVDLKTAEMTKHALNAFFATCVSFANELGGLCDEIGADGVRIAEAMRCDERVGPKALIVPGGPFGGGTLARDVTILKRVGKAHAYETFLIDAVLNVNARQKRLVQRRLQRLFGSLQGLTVGVLGLTYKAGTSTLRRSPVIELMNELIAGGAQVKAYDPKADLTELDSAVRFRICPSVNEVAEGTDALIIATEWPEFKELDYAVLRPTVRRPVILDTKNLLVPEQIAQAGFLYVGIGRGAPVGSQGGNGR